MKQPSPLKKKLQELQANPQTTYSVDSHASTVGLDTEEINSQDTRFGNITGAVLSQHISKAEREQMEYENSNAKKEIDALNKKEFQDGEKQIEEIEKQIKAIEESADSYQEFDNPLSTDVFGNTTNKDAFGNSTKTKALKPEAKLQIQALKQAKKNSALQFEGHPELSKINDRIQSLENKYQNWKGADEDTNFTANPFKFMGEAFQNLTANVVNTFTNPEKYMTAQEKSEYNKLKARRDNFYKPIAEQKDVEWEIEEGALNVQLSDPSLPLSKRWQLKNLRDQVTDNRRELQAYLNNEDGSDSFFRKMGGVSLRVNEQGEFRPYTDLVDNIFNYIYKDDLYTRAGSRNYEGKFTNFENLSDEDKRLLEIYAKLDDDKSFLSDKQKWSYHIAEQTAHSVGFVRDIMIADRITGGLAKYTRASTLGSALPSVVAEGALGFGVRKGIARTLGAGTNMAVSGTRLAASTFLENHINPEYLNNELMKGSYIQRDENGEIKDIFVKDKLYEYMKDVYNDTAINYAAEKVALEKKERLTTEEENRLNLLKIKLGEVSSMTELSLDEELKTFKPYSGSEAELRAFGKMASERIAEVYTAKLFNLAGKGINRIPGVGKFTTRMGTKLDNLNTSFKNTKVGRLYDNVTKTVGRVATDAQGNPIINSMPMEVAEEYVTAASNSLQERDMKELADMFDVQANVDIAAQTLLMTSMFGLAGNVQTNSKLMLNRLANNRIKDLEKQVESLKSDISEEGKSKYEAAKLKLADMKTNPSYIGSGIVKLISGQDDASFKATKEYISNRREIRKRIDQLKQANGSEEVNKIVNLMTASSGFSISDVNEKIKALRNQNKLDEAKALEDAMFQNLVTKSFRGGVQDEFAKALEKLSKDTKLGLTTRFAAQKAQANMEQLNTVYERYKDRNNVGAIVSLAYEKLLLKQGQEEIEQEKAKLAEATAVEIDAFLEANNMQQDYSMTNLFTRKFDNLAEQEQYNNFLDKLLAYNNTAIDNYVGLENKKLTLQSQLLKTMNAMNEIITPSQATLNKQEFLKRLEEDYNEIVAGTGKVINHSAKFNYNNELIPDVEFIEELFEGLRKTSIGKISEGKISENTFNELKQETIDNLEKKKRIDKIKKMLNEQAAILATRAEQEDAEENLPTVQGNVTVVDTEGENIFAEEIKQGVAAANAILGNDINLSDPDSQIIPNDNEFDLQIENQYSAEQLKLLKAFVKDTVEKIEAKLNRKPTFREFMEQTYKYAEDKASVQNIFNATIKGWEENGYTPENYQEVYNDLFNPFEDAVTNYLQAVTNLFEQQVPAQNTSPYLEAEQKTEKIETEVAKSQSTLVAYDEENNPQTKTAVEEVKTRRTLNVQPKIGFTSLMYDETIEDGVYVRNTKGDTLNYQEGDLIDFRDLLNPDKYKTGDKLGVEIAPESLWSQIKVSNGRNQNGELQTVTFAQWLSTKESNNPNFRNTQEFKNKVPMFYVSETGKRLGYVQDVDWYTPYNVANPFGSSANPNMPTEAWLKHLQEGIEATENLRNNIMRGLKEVTIQKPNDGIFYKIPKTEPFITLEESNPQSIIAVQRGSNLHTSFKEEFNKGQLLNTNDEGKFGFETKGPNNTNSHTWMISRIGFTVNDKGETVESYRAYPVVRKVSEQQIETVKWALAAHLTLKGWTEDLKNTEYAMTVDKAKKIQRDINSNMNYNIENPKQMINFMKTFFQTKVEGDSLASYRNLLFKGKVDNVFDHILQHTNLEMLNNRGVKSIVHIEKGTVVPLNVNYEDYLKKTLYTNIKSFNVGTENSPVYATVIQPVINVTYNEVAETEPILSKVQAAAEVVVQQLEAKQESSEAVQLDVDKHIAFLDGIGVDYRDFEKFDSLIENTDKLANIFKTAGNLNILQEKAIRQYIVHSIGEKKSFEYGSTDSPAKISAETKSELNLLLNKVEKQIKSLLEDLEGKTDERIPLLKEAYETTLKNISDIKENFDNIFDKAFRDIQKQTAITINEDEENENIDDVSLSIKDYNKDSIEESGKSKASYRLRRFLHKIPKYDTEGLPQTTYLGLPLYMSFNDVYNELTKVLAMGSEVVSDYNFIINKLKNSSSPFVKDVLVKLENADQQIKNEFVYNFVRHTLSSKFAMFETNQKDGISLKIYDTNSNEARRVIDKAWLNESKASPLYNKDLSFNPVYAQELIDEYESWDKDYRKVPEEDLRNWLGKIGFSFQDGAWKQIMKEGIYNSNKWNTFNDLYTQNNGGLFVPIINFLKQGIKNPEKFEYTTKVNPLGDLKGVRNALQLIEAHHNPNLIALSFRDSGKNISTQVPTKYATDLVQTLKRSLSEEGNTLIDDLQSLSLSENSIILQLLKEEPDFVRAFELSHVGLTAVKERGTNPTRSSITELSDIDYFLTVLTGFQDRKVEKLPETTKIGGVSMRIANMLFPTMSDKSTGLFLKTAVFDFIKDSNLLFDIDESGKIEYGEQLKDLLFNQLIMPELKRIIKFHKEVKGTNIKNYDNAASLFHFLPVLNTIKDENGINVVEKLATLEQYNIEDILEKYRDIFTNAMIDVINTEVNHVTNTFASYTETNRDGKPVSTMFDTKYFQEVGKNPATDYNIAIHDFVLNSLIFNSEVFKVFAGDIANYSQDKLYKHNGNKVSPYEVSDSSFYISLNKEIGVNLGKRLALLIAPGNKLADSYNEKYNQIFLEDSIDIAENAAYLIKNYYGSEALKEALPILQKYNKALDLIDKHEQGVSKLSVSRYDSLKGVLKDQRDILSEKFPDLDGYFDIESTDAQEYTTAMEHINILHRMGRISASEFKNISHKLLSNQKLTKEELNIVFQPIKPVHTGTYINKDWDVNRVVYIKSSSFPLIPQLTAGTKLDNLRKKMEELESNTGRFTRASFQTANKVGATKKTINPFNEDSLNDIKEYEDTDINSKVLVLNRNNFRIQQDVPFKSDKKSDDKVSMGTQIFKLLFGDGIIDVEDFTLNGQTVTGKQLYDKYSKAFANIIDTKKQELFLDLGLNEQGIVINEAQFIKKLQDLLVKEATKRGYSIKSLAGLKIEQLAAKAGYYYEFKTPLWLSSDSNRYESLLNSIITNRVMKHKMPGNGFVAGSESGFKFKENLEGIDESRIIYLDNWNGKELQGAHTTTTEGDIIFHKAQVFAPSKFKNNDKVLIDLFEGYNQNTGDVTNAKYLKRNENGTLGLKEGMISDELLNNFSFRTPTSSHVSASTIEIVGFLPPESGDLMIVPKNFTKQKGLDYDIDKESAYQLNHILREDGSIDVLKEEDVIPLTNHFREVIEKLNLENVVAERKAGMISEFMRSLNAKGNFLDEESITQLLLPQVSVQEKIKRAELNLRRKLAENEFIRINLSVFNNPNPVVQTKINKILSMDFARGQAQKFEQLNAEGEKNKAIARYMNQMNMSELDANNQYEKDSLNFTMLTYNYQKNKMSLGSIGKIAIGVYANYTTFNGLLEQNKVKSVFIQDEEGNPKTFIIGTQESTGILGEGKTIDGKRSPAEAWAERENTATDNEKEQILGRVGVDESTINTDSLILARGFDMNEKGDSVSYMLLSQPVIKEFNKARKSSKGILGDYINDNELIKQIVEKLSDGKITYGQYGEGFDLKYYFASREQKEDTVIASKLDYRGSKLLTGEALLEGIRYFGSDAEVQLHSFMTYVELEKEGRAVSNVQKTININTLGKSMIESQMKFQSLAALPDNSTIANAESLLGEFLETQGTRTDGFWIHQTDRKEPKSYYVVPTTPQGQIVINGLYLGNTLYKDFFPYQDEAILSTVKEILSIQGKDDVSETTIIENFETIVEEMKKYIYSRQGNNIFDTDPRAKRYELFKDSEDNTSLSTYLKDVLKSEDSKYRKGINALKQNTLLRSFTYETGKADEELSLIKYNNAATDNLDEEDLYNSIPELVLLNIPLPDRNGQPYSTMKLAEDLVAYSFLEGGIQEATQFVKYVPVEFLESIGQYENQRKYVNGEIVEEKVFIPANRKLQAFNSKKNSSIGIFNIALGLKDEEVSTFTKQYFQHNPDKAPRISYKDRKNLKNDTFNYANNSGNSPMFVSVKNKKGSAQKYSLYQNKGMGFYEKIDILGTMGISEYQYKNENVTSLINNKVKVSQPIPSSQQVKKLEIDDKTTVEGLLKQISQAEFSPKYQHLVEAAKWLLPNIKSKGQLRLDNSIAGSGKAYRNSLDIVLNPTLTLEVSDEKTAMVFIHELLHTVSANELTKYFDSTGTQLREDVKIPDYVTNLFGVFNEFRSQFKSEIDTLQSKLSKGINISDYTEREKSVIYAGTNIFEFITVSMTSPMFQEEMNNIKFKSTDKTFWEKLKETIANIISGIYPSLKEDSIAHAAIISSIEFIKVEADMRHNSENYNLIPPDVQYELDREESEKQYYAKLDLSKEVDNINNQELGNPENDITDENNVDLMIENTNNLPNFEPCN